MIDNIVIMTIHPAPNAPPVVLFLSLFFGDGVGEFGGFGMFAFVVVDEDGGGGIGGALVVTGDGGGGGGVGDDVVVTGTGGDFVVVTGTGGDLVVVIVLLLAMLTSINIVDRNNKIIYILNCCCIFIFDFLHYYGYNCFLYRHDSM